LCSLLASFSLVISLLLLVGPPSSSSLPLLPLTEADRLRSPKGAPGGGGSLSAPAAGLDLTEPSSAALCSWGLSIVGVDVSLLA